MNPEGILGAPEELTHTQDVQEIPKKILVIMNNNREYIKKLLLEKGEDFIQALLENPLLAGFSISLENNQYDITTPEGHTYHIEADSVGAIWYILWYRKMRQVIQWCFEQGIEVAAFWGLSTENIKKRPIKEQRIIYRIIEQETAWFVQEAQEKGIQIKVVGNREKLSQLTSWDTPGSVLTALDNAVEETKFNTKMTVGLLLAYNGDDEMERASSARMEEIMNLPDFPVSALVEERIKFMKVQEAKRPLERYREFNIKLGESDTILKTQMGNPNK